MGKINSTGMITHWLLSTVDLPPQRWAQSFRPQRSWRLGAWPEVLRTVGNVQSSYVLPRVQGAHYHERRPRVVLVDRLLPSSLCQDGPMWTAELDEFRSLFQLVCHIQGKTRRYQGAEDRNTDKLLSSFFSSLFSARIASYVHTGSIVEKLHNALTKGRLFITRPSQNITLLLILGGGMNGWPVQNFHERTRCMHFS